MSYKEFEILMQKVILETIKKYNLFEKNNSVIVAVSGGADSMALLHFMKHFATTHQLRLIVAHVNHKKRENSELDEILVEQVSRAYDLPYEVYYLPKTNEVENFHEYARNKRYEFFKSVANDYGAGCLVTAHHADDQLETQLHRFLYQNIPSGLIGIEPTTINEGLKVVRPLIAVTKKQIYEYCEKEQVLFREDESNKSDVYTRNRIRKYIVPELVKESPSIYEHARMISEQLSEDEAYFSAQVDQLMSHVFQSEGTFEVSRSFLQELPPSLMRRLIKRILQKFTLKDIQTMHIEEIQKLVKVVEETSPNIVSAYKQRLYDKIKETLNDKDVDEQRLITEVAIFADRVAVDEETVRLNSHINQFLQLIKENEPVGRKLDFLVQEMNRETNTIGSKAQDVKIAQVVVDIKSLIEKIREQIQNIE